jgi:prolyl-tRNA synthetase
MLDKISADMMSNAMKRLATSAETIKSLDDLPKKILRFGWCGSEDCGHKIEEKTELKLLGTPYISESFQGECIMCGKQTSIVAYAARSM